MSAFRVLKLVPNFIQGRILWEEVGELETDYNYLHPGAQEIGEKFGTGRFLTIKADDDASAKEKVVAARATHYEFVDEAVSA